jgi:hypothetical protein
MKELVLTEDAVELLVSTLEWQIQDLSNHREYLLEQKEGVEANLTLAKIGKLHTLRDYIKSV